MHFEIIKAKKKDKKTRLLSFVYISIIYAFLSFFIFLIAVVYVVGDVSQFTGKFLLDSPPKFTEMIKNDFTPAKKIIQKTLPLEEVEFPLYGNVFGSIKIPKIKLKCPLLWGDNDDCLKEGAGQYIGSLIPGYGGVSLISGHNYYPFQNLKDVKKGNKIQITTTYGVYSYKVSKTLITSSLNIYAYDLSKKDNSIILYTCIRQYNKLGNVLMRFYVYADFEDGPVLVK